MRRAAWIVCCFVGLGMASCCFAQHEAFSKGKTLKGRAAFGDWHDDAPGVRRLIKADDLPGVTREKKGEMQIVPMPRDAAPKVPPGFRVELIASGLAQPRVIRAAPNGDLFVANSKANEVRIYQLSPGGGKPNVDAVFLDNLRKPYGIAFYPAEAPQWIYVANADGVVRVPYKAGEIKSAATPEPIVERLPTAHHWTRDIAFSADGKDLFVAVGSGSNIALDMFPEPKETGGLDAWKKNKPIGAAWDTEELRADIIRYDVDGKNMQIYATGLRNPSGIAIQPTTGRLWTVVNERDGLGDDTPFEYATAVKQGHFYGWPWYYIGKNEDPRHKDARRDLYDKVTVPDVLMQAHSAALQIAFYQGDMFPAEYRDSAFVTLHGSWDRSKLTGYKVVRLLFDPSGKATGEYEDFMTGFVVSDKQVWGRPVGVTVGSDGALYVTEDGNGTIWRVSYGAK